MRKGIAGAVAALVVLALAAPFGFSFLAETRLRSLLEEINADGMVRADLIAFERGWLQSRADVVVEVTGDIATGYMDFVRAQGEDPAPLRCTVRSVVHHGPIPQGVGAAGPAVAVLTSDLVDGDVCRRAQRKLGLTLTTHLDLGGGGRIQAAIPEHHFADAEKGTFDWQGLNLDVRYEDGFRSVVTAMEAPGLSVSGERADVRMGAVALNSAMRRGIADLGLGDFSLTLASLAVRPKSGEGVVTRLDDVALEGFSREGGEGTVDAEVLLRAGDVAVGDLALGAATYKVALRHIDAKALAKINQTVVDLRAKELPPEQVNMMLGATLLGLLPDLLKHGPVLEISELSLGRERDRLRGSGQVTVDVSDPAVLQNPLMLKDALLLDLELELPESLLVGFSEFGLRRQLAAAGTEYSDEHIASMAQMGVRERMARENMRRLFVLQDGVYRMRLQMADGRFSINGAPVDPGAFVSAR